MTVAVNLNDKPEFGTIEIYDVIVNRFLAKEFVFGELPHAEDFVPDFAFGNGRVFAVFTGTGGEVLVVGEKGKINCKPLPSPPLVRGGI